MKPMVILTGAAVSLVLLFGTKASANTIITAAPGSPPYQGWVNRSHVPSPTVGIEVITAECGGLGCTTGESIIEISPLALGHRSTFLHELGHVFDATVLTDEDRQRLMALMATNPEWWNANPSLSSAETFADAYMQCARLPRIDPHWEYTVSGGALIGWRLRRVCEYIRSVGGTQ
jgi:hypothetical protein